MRASLLCNVLGSHYHVTRRRPQAYERTRGRTRNARGNYQGEHRSWRNPGACHRRRICGGGRLSQSADYAGGAVPAGRKHHDRSAQRRRQAERGARAADRRRQPRRRRRHHRHPRGVAHRTGRLHAAPRLYRDAGHRSHALPQCWLRPAQGFRRHWPHRPCPQLARRASVVQRAFGERADRVRQGESRQGQLWLGRGRHREPRVGRLFRDGCGHRTHPYPLQGHRAGARRPARRPYPHGVRADPCHTCQRGGRQLARPCGDQPQTLEPVARRANHRRIRRARIRGLAVLWPGGAGRHAAPHHRKAQQGAARRARERRGEEAPRHRRDRADAEHAGRVRRPYRPRRDQVVEGGEGFRRQGRVAPMFMPLARLRYGAIGLALVAGLCVAAAATEDYPDRPITLVVPYAAGGGNDAMARTVADKLSRVLRQPVVVVNRGGAGGTIATRQVARSAPDGSTLVIGGTGTLAINPTLYDNVGYDPRKDFAPVGLIGASALVVLVNPAVPAKSIRELIALAAKEPGQFNYASAGVGSGIHLATALFEYMADIKLTHVPYRGSGPALTDLLGGHVAIYFSSLPPAVQLVREGKVRVLGVTAATRSRVLPEVPTVAEAGLPGYESVLHYGIVAPAGTPRPIIDKLNAALREAVMAPDTQERMGADGTEPHASTPDEYAADIDREETKWSAIVRKSGAKAE